MSDSAGTIHALARWLCAAWTAPLPPAALSQARLLLLDTLGCGLAGWDTETARAARAVIGRGDGTLIGTAERSDLLGAVLANGVAIRALDLNDYLIGMAKGGPDSGGHPSDNLPVALTVGEARGATGAAILRALVLGYELYARLRATIPAGAWDGVSASGLAAPAMAGLLMGLDEARLAHALALGAARGVTSAAVRSGALSAAKSLANALVAQSGVQAALLAEQGVTGPTAILDHKRGLRAVFATETLSDILTAPFPEEGGAVCRAHVKAYPCVATAQSAVAAALRLHARLGGALSAIARLDVAMADYPRIRHQQEEAERARPTTREAADHSFPFLIAIALRDGALGLAQFAQDQWHDPEIAALMAKIALRTDPAWNARAPGTYPCAIRAEASDGRVWTVEVDYPPGFSRNGLDAAEVLAKFHALTAPLLDAPARQRVVDAVAKFEHSRDATTLCRALALS